VLLVNQKTVERTRLRGVSPTKRSWVGKSLKLILRQMDFNKITQPQG